MTDAEWRDGITALIAKLGAAKTQRDNAEVYSGGRHLEALGVLQDAEAKLSETINEVLAFVGGNNG